MRPKLKYPLTDGAKETARYLVDMWNSGKLNQHFVLHDSTSGNVNTREVSIGLGRIAGENIEPLPFHTLLELAQFNLINMVRERRESQSSHLIKGSFISSSWEVLLMQELRNAVETDFEVSDFFLTTQAVGTVVLAERGSSISFNSPFMSAAANFGDIQQTAETPAEVAEVLTRMLGDSILQANGELAEAINSLRTTTETDRESKVGRVISQLGRSLGHTANTAVVAQALVYILPMLSHLIG